jgi:phospholipase C
MTQSCPESIHQGWRELFSRIRRGTPTRRRFISSAATTAGGLVLWSMLPSGCAEDSNSSSFASSSSADHANWSSNNAIKHVVILCQENRSFDHYFGAFASMFGSGSNTAEGFNPEALAYYDSADAVYYHPYHLAEFCNYDPDHTWAGSHIKWNDGAMDGWVVKQEGNTGSIAYLERADHIYDPQLAQAFTLCDQYFCSQIGPTLPNRLYLWTGTSGWNYLSPPDASGLPYNNPSFSVAPPVLGWQTMADVLDAAGLPWKCYSIADGSVPSPVGAFNPLVFFSQIQDNPGRLARATTDFSEFAADLAAGTLPAVSWIVTQVAVSEHPPAPPDMGQLLVARVVRDLMASSAWSSTALFVTYDEGGGFFDHVPPKILEYVPSGLPDADLAVGPAFRTPMIIVSPWAPPNTVFSGVIDHTSILQFMERTFSTSSTPITLPTIPAARRELLADLTQAFDFTQEPNNPALPTAAQLYAGANKTLLAAGSGGCSNHLPSWLASLLGVSSGG